MATVKVREAVGRIERIAQDDGVHWPRVEYQTWINEFYAAAVTLRPDLNTKIETLDCEAGANQSLATAFPNAIRLLDVRRNVAATSKKRAIRREQRDQLNRYRPTWLAESESVDVEFFAFDDILPLAFSVFPPATSAAQVEVVFAEIPAAHALSESELDPEGEDDTVINVPDVYIPAMVDYVLYRAYGKDTDVAESAARSDRHYAAFERFMGVKTEADLATSPSNRKK